jgi:chromosome segregation ATPase
MADGISDERFKKEMLRLMKSIALKVGENAKEIALLRTDVDKNTRAFKKLRKEIRASLELDKDVRFRVLEIYNRLWEIEDQVSAVALRLPDLKEEYERLRSETLKLFTDIDDNADAKVQLDELNVWVENLEEKVFV